MSSEDEVLIPEIIYESSGDLDKIVEMINRYNNNPVAEYYIVANVAKRQPVKNMSDE